MIKNTIALLLISIIFINEIKFTQSAFNIQMFNGVTGCNVYLIYDSQKSMLVDAGGVQDTPDLINFISAQGIDKMDLIFITHGHPDHYGGSGQLSSQFPGAKFAVGSNDVKSELIENAQEVQITDFDFSNDLEVVGNTETTLSHFSLKIITDFVAGESLYTATLFNQKSNIFFSADVLFVDAHLYLGPSLDLPRVVNWHDENLPSLSAGGRLGLTESTVVYPGHGIVGSPANVEQNMDYLNSFLDTLLTCVQGVFPTLEEVADILTSQHPSYLGSTSFITYNTAWTDLQDQIGSCYDSIDYFASSDSTISSKSSNNSSILSVSLIFVVVLIFFAC